MAYVPHSPVKDKLIVDTGLEILGEKVDVLSTMTRFAPEKFFGSEGDTISVKVKGTLPVRHYGFRNDRSQPIKTDVYKETKVDLTVSAEDAYSAVALTEEQKAFDLTGGFGDLVDAQTDAIAEDTQRKALEHILDAPFEACLAIDPSTANLKSAIEIGQDYIYNQLVAARQILTKLRAPEGERFVRAGSTIAALIRMNQRLIRVQGDPSASAFSQYDIGQIAGFNIVEDPYMPDDEAIVYVKSAYQFWNYAPAVPDGAFQGGIGNKNGIAMTWIYDYDSSYQVDRSSWKTWRAWGHAKDMLKQINEDKTQTLIGKEQYFLRGLKIKIGNAAVEADGSLSTTNIGFVPGDGRTDKGGDRKGASATSELGLVYTGKPFAGSLPEGVSHDYSRVEVADSTPEETP
ncbi:hypothetical protein [Glutamicibacter creatinolyticus]|uniref:phage major capsid protein n=1 Tax=Glutamicibacter creatinolyticus TaxID=162496 RepID=UPI003216B2AA